MATVSPTVGSPQPPSRRVSRTLLSLGVEVLLIFALLSLYNLGRTLASGRVKEAEENASHLWHVERSLHLVNEVHLQDLIMHSTALVEWTNRYYVMVHFPLTGIFMVWLFLRYRGSYYRVRNTIVLLTGLGLIFTVLVPLAPPRLFTGDSLIDTMQVFGPTVYDANSTQGIANQYAAMPSLHVAWATLVGLAVIRISRSRWRWLAILHPLITIFVVVATGNHYWLDCAVGLLLLAMAAMVVYRFRWITAAAAITLGARRYARAADLLASWHPIGVPSHPVAPGATASPLGPELGSAREAGSAPAAATDG
ncbi:MAG TPA: phosphatase PAP2 family protein [Mycobacteriales bacterium]|jgi:hypothetical protein|nr:phosphatase PAP2 family protein [Mycobacteriales bacterium]